MVFLSEIEKEQKFGRDDKVFFGYIEVFCLFKFLLKFTFSVKMCIKQLNGYNCVIYIQVKKIVYLYGFYKFSFYYEKLNFSFLIFFIEF